MTTSPATAHAPAEPSGFRHETVFYREDESFLRSVLPYVRGGLDAGEAVVVAAPPARLDLLRGGLDDDADAVEFLDMTEVGANPARIIARWQDAVTHHLESGRGLRGIGEPAYHGRRPAELLECHLHELLLGRAFGDGPAWRLLCPYDERRLPAAVCTAAAALHPLHLGPDGSVRPSGEEAPDVLDAFGTPLPPPPVAALRGEYAAEDLATVRRTVVRFALASGCTEEQTQVLELAASELVTNSIRHGGGAGSVAMWTEPGEVVLEFSDPGRITEPLTGRLAPPADRFGGRGLYLVNQLCDLVQLRSSPAGTSVRVTTWL